LAIDGLGLPVGFTATIPVDGVVFPDELGGGAVADTGWRAATSLFAGL
jgi:hypothetical protein